MRHSQSNLSSLATLLQNAEARHSATPPVAVSDPTAEDDSGLIDILAMQRRAQEERASAAAAVTRTPVPVVTAVRGATTDPDFIASLAKSRRRMKRIVIGVVAGAVAMLAVGLGVRSLHRSAAAARAAAAAPVATVAPPPPPLAPPVVVAPPIVQPPLPTIAPEPVAASAPASGKAKKGHKASKAKSKKAPKASAGN